MFSVCLLILADFLFKSANEFVATVLSHIANICGNSLSCTFLKAWCWNLVSFQKKKSQQVGGKAARTRLD
jgi:hypothetical protein